jgi:hypothetical protein
MQRKIECRKKFKRKRERGSKMEVNGSMEYAHVSYSSMGRGEFRRRKRAV